MARCLRTRVIISQAKRVSKQGLLGEVGGIVIIVLATAFEDEEDDEQNDEEDDEEGDVD